MEDIDAAAAAAGGDDQGTAKGATTNLVLPTHPGLDALAHVGGGILLRHEIQSRYWSGTTLGGAGSAGG